MGQNIRETGRRRARVTAVAIGTSSVLGAAAIAAVVYTPSAVQTVSNTSGNGSGSERRDLEVDVRVDRDPHAPVSAGASRRSSCAAHSGG